MALAVSGIAYGHVRWRSATRRMHARLEAARLPAGRAGVYRSHELAGLPPPVQRYFRAVLTESQPVVAAVTVEHAGTFNMSETGARWYPFTSTQRTVTRRPGFDWEARIYLFPGVAVRVHDAYIAGEGILRASLFGVLPLVNRRGTPELAQGELLRFLAEAAWYPTALLPSQGVRWEAIDDGTARATLSDGDTTASVVVHFAAADGLIETVRAVRGRIAGREVVPTPWEGRWARYESRAGMQIPTEGEVAWVAADGPRPYWRGRVTRIAYEFVF